MKQFLFNLRVINFAKAITGSVMIVTATASPLVTSANESHLDLQCEGTLSPEREFLLQILRHDSTGGLTTYEASLQIHSMRDSSTRTYWITNLDRQVDFDFSQATFEPASVTYADKNPDIYDNSTGKLIPNESFFLLLDPSHVSIDKGKKAGHLKAKKIFAQFELTKSEGFPKLLEPFDAEDVDCFLYR